MGKPEKALLNNRASLAGKPDKMLRSPLARSIEARRNAPRWRVSNARGARNYGPGVDRDQGSANLPPSWIVRVHEKVKTNHAENFIGNAVNGANGPMIALAI